MSERVWERPVLTAGRRVQLSVGKRRGLSQAAALVLLVFSTLPDACRAARPDIVWMAGGHAGAVRSVAFSPDGQTLATASEDSTVKLWRVSDGALVRTLSGHEGYVNSVAFSPDGQMVASASHDKTIRLWRVSDGVLLRTLTGHTRFVTSVAFSPDGQTLASGGGWDDRTVRLWRVSDGALLRTLVGHTDRVNSVAFSPDGQALASGSDDKNIRLWRVSDGDMLRMLSGHTGHVNSVNFSPDGQALASGSSDTTVRLWRVSDGALTRTLTGHSDAVYSVRFSPDGQRLVSGAGWNDKTIRLWRVSDGVLLRTVTGHTSYVYSVAFSPDGQMLASGGGYDDRTVRLWRVSDGAQLGILTRHTDEVKAVAFSPDGQTLASGGGYDDQTVRLWRVSDGVPVRLLSGQTDGVYAVAFSPNGQFLAIASGGFSINLARVSDGQIINSLYGHYSYINSVAFSPDGQFLASASSDLSVNVWRLSDGSLVRSLFGHSDEVTSVAFSPDGQTLASGGGNFDRTVKLWRVSDGELLHTLHGHAGGVTSVAFSPDGQRLASAGGSDDRTVRLWRVSDGQLLRTLHGHDGGVTSVAFSPDGQTLASAGGADDRTVRLWRVSDGALLETYNQDTGSGVNSVAISPSGSKLAWGRRDATVLMASLDRVSPPQLNPPGGDFDSAVTVTITCPTPGAVIRYTTNGADPTLSDPVIPSGGTVTVDRSLTLKARAWKDGAEPSSVSIELYRLIVRAPVFSPAGGDFASAVNVTVTCPTPGAVIRYTTNGADPTETDPVIASGGTVVVDRSLTLKARAWKAGLEPSAITTAAFTKVSQVTIGTGTSSWDLPLSTLFHDARTQTIYLASEIGSAGTITSLALDVTLVPGSVMNNFTIRMKHTPLSQYAQGWWESTGWTTVYQADELVGTTGWRRFIFQTPFDYNGVDNLMVDFSFNNSSNASDGYCRFSTPGGNRTVYYRTDGVYGDPLEWWGASPTPRLINRVPNIRLWLDPVAVGERKGVGEAKLSADQTPVEIQGVIVSAAFDGFFYVQSPDRSSGIRVHRAGHGLSAGQVVNLSGTVKTNAHGERYIEAAGVTVLQAAAVAPVAMNQRTVGGGVAGSPPAGQAGVTGGTGLNNVGLLVRVTGKVTAIAGDGSWVTIWDGSPVHDAGGNPGIRCITPGMLPAVVTTRDTLSITGPVSIVKAGNVVYPQILARSSADITLP